MKVSLQWLRDYVPIRLTVADLAHQLSMAGNDVESIERQGGDWQGIRVAEVVRIEKHPNADRLVLATLDLGTERRTVVTGAPNLAVGQKVPFAPTGTRLIDGHTGEPTVLKPAKIRGIDSAGMVCSAKELGLGDDHTGILVLGDGAQVGQELADLLGDAIFDIKTTPNRPDTLSMVGVAREVAAITGDRVLEPLLEYPATESPVAGRFRVEIEAPDLCHRYCAALVEGVNIGPSPEWLRQRLIAAGMRPINNVVDITNYVMMEVGQPLHAFDAGQLTDRTIIVRRARKGERLVTLDGVDRPLDESMLAIADSKTVVALAGVMGGLASEVTDSTRTILLESANFQGITIRQTASALRMRSEASLRFEKGISPELAEVGLRRAVRLLVELAGGRAAEGLIDVYPGKQEPQPMRLSERDVERVLGITWPRETLGKTFRRLGFLVDEVDGALSLTPPYWRVDVRLTEDLVEEAARIIGYDELPVTMLRGSVPASPPDALMEVADAVRDILVAAGMHEAISYPLVGRDLLAKVDFGSEPLPEPLALVNPMSADQAVLRTSMRSSLLQTLADNRRHTDEGIALFEVGTVYLPRDGDLPEERRVVAGVLSGTRGRRTWHGSGAPYDFFDGKGVLEALVRQLRLEASFVSLDDPFYRTGRAAEIRVGGEPAGSVGEIHPPIGSGFDLRGPVIYFEIALAKLTGTKITEYEPFARFPAVVQDIAVVVDRDVESDRIRQALASGRHVREVSLFDVYEGTGVPPGKRSLAFNLRFQAADRTLTEDEASRIRDGLVERLRRQFGATLRA